MTEFEAQQAGQEIFEEFDGYFDEDNKKHVLKLIKKGADPSYNDGDESILIRALNNDEFAIAKALLEAGADVFFNHDPDNNEGALYAAEDRREYYDDDDTEARALDQIIKTIKQKLQAGQAPTWNLFDSETVTSTSESLTSKLKVTDMFNFRSHERTRVIENKSTNAMSASTPVPFSDIEPEVLRAAFDLYVKKGGLITEDVALSSVGSKSQPVFNRKM